MTGEGSCRPSVSYGRFTDRRCGALITLPDYGPCHTTWRPLPIPGSALVSQPSEDEWRRVTLRSITNCLLFGRKFVHRVLSMPLRLLHRLHLRIRIRVVLPQF